MDHTFLKFGFYQNSFYLEGTVYHNHSYLPWR